MTHYRKHQRRKNAKEELAFERQRKGSSWLFSIAILKGLIEHQDGTATGRWALEVKL